MDPESKLAAAELLHEAYALIGRARSEADSDSSRGLYEVAIDSLIEALEVVGVN